MEINGKEISIKSLELDGIDSTDYPDFCDSYFSYAEYEDGTKLTNEELEIITDKYADVINELAHESFH